MNHRFGSRILDLGIRLLIPFIIVFGSYVVIHGHYGPGGGFQGGTILSVAYITLRIVNGSASNFSIKQSNLIFLGFFGLFVYYFTGLTSLFSSSFLDYSVVFGKGHHRALGSLSIEIGVAITVASTLALIYECLSSASISEKDSA